MKRMLFRRISLFCLAILAGMAVILINVIPVLAANPPAVRTVAVADITNTSARLSGSLDSLGTASSVSVSFEYGRTTGYGNTTSSQVMTSTGDFNTSLSGLSSGATYHFRAKADGGANGITYGSDVTFDSLNPPTVTTGQANNVVEHGARLNGSLNSLGSSTSINVYFQYGISTSYGMVTSAQTVTSITTFSIDVIGLENGTVYHFRAVADGGVNGIAYGKDATLFTTPISPTAATSIPLNVSYASASLRGNLLYLGTAETVNVSFEYGTTTSYGTSTSKAPYTSSSDIKIDINNLATGTLYHYRIKADGGIHGVSYGSDVTFTTQTAVAPQLGMASYSDVNYFTVTLVGNLAGKGTASSIALSFEYGTSTSYGTSIAAKANKSGGVGYYGGFYADVTGLQQGTIYHFRAKADGGLHGVTYSDDVTFTTVGNGVVPVPAVATLGVSSVTLESANVSGNLTSIGTLTSIGVYFEYGTSTSYGNTTAEQSVKTTGEFSADIKDLAPGKLYHFRAVANDGIKYKVMGNDLTFNTPSVTAEVNTASASDVTDTAAVLNGSVVLLGTASSVNVFFEYGISSFYGKSTTAQSAAAPGSFNVAINGLKPETEYHFRIKADGGTSGIVAGDDRTFTTMSESQIIVDTSSLVISPATVKIGENVNISIDASNTGSSVANYKMELSINGISTDTQQIELKPGAKQQVEFTAVEHVAGTYQVSVNGITGSFTVEDDDNGATTNTAASTTTSSGSQTLGSQLFLFIALGVVIVVGLIIFLIRKYERR
jgi:hypothetical protein